MSYARIWLCPSLKRKDWVEVFSKSRRLISNHETFPEEAIEEKLRVYGEFKVMLAMGGNSLDDELYLFLHEADARRFFAGGPLAPGEHGYHDREYVTEDAGPGGCDVGIGFDRVEVNIQGKMIDRHSGSALEGKPKSPEASLW
jgi:hypothetical protein